MIALDSNLLLYAHMPSFSQHERVNRWLDDLFTTAHRIALPWSSILSFLRVATNPRAFSEPASLGQAWAQVDEWLNDQIVWTPSPTSRHRDVLAECLRVPGLRADDVPDAHLAALAIEHGLRLASADSGFARFPDLDWFNPLAPT